MIRLRPPGIHLRGILDPVPVRLKNGRSPAKLAPLPRCDSTLRVPSLSHSHPLGLRPNSASATLRAGAIISRPFRSQTGSRLNPAHQVFERLAKSLICTFRHSTYNKHFCQFFWFLFIKNLSIPTQFLITFISILSRDLFQ